MLQASQSSGHVDPGEEWEAYKQAIKERLALKQALSLEDDGNGQFPYFFKDAVEPRFNPRELVTQGEL